MITAETLKTANEGLSKITFKNKGYAMVTERVKAFREICPCGKIVTEIIEMGNGVVTMKATIADEQGNIIATGFAQEKEDGSYINKTSYVENCETSAIGRALGFVGIGIDDSIASADELANALANQEAQTKKIGKKEKTILENMCKKKGLDPATVFPGGLDLTDAQYVEATKRLCNMPDKQ